MLSTETILKGIGEEITAKLKSDIKSKSLVAGYPPPNASGKLHDSIRYEVEDNVLKVYARDYIYYLEHGRKSGKRPPRSVIRKWIDDKRIVPKKDAKGKEISKDSLAFLIQRAIGEKGTLIHQQGGSDLIRGIINKQFIEHIREELIFNVVGNFKSEVLKVAA